MPKKKKLRYIHVVLIVLVSAITLVTSALLITNIFIPVKYLGAYFVIGNKNIEGELRITYIDVGYGDSTVIELPDGKTVLIDGGSDSYQSKYKVLHQLNSLGIDTVDYLICSSVSAERCGGLSDILKYKTVKEIFMPYCPYTHVTDEYRSFILEMQEKEYIKHIIEYGIGFESEDYGLYFLSPSAIDLEDGEIDKFLVEPNRLANKFIDGIDIGGRNIDISKCKVLKVPNHGRAVDNFVQLLEKTKPQAAIISVGDNGFACPSVQTVSDIQNFVKENFYRTDYDGTITVKLKSGTLSIYK